MRTAVLTTSALLFLFPVQPGWGQGIIEESGMPPSFDLRGRTVAVIAGPGAEYNETRVIPGYWITWGAKVIYVGPVPSMTAEEMVVNARGFVPLERELAAEIPLEEFDPLSADVIYFPGGKSPASLLERNRQAVVDIVQRAQRGGKVLAAFCHGPAVLLAAGAARGRRVTGEVGSEEAKRAGALPVVARVVEDNGVITGSYPFLESFAVAVARRLARGAPQQPAEPDAQPAFAFGITARFDTREVPDEAVRAIVQQAMLTTHDFPLNLYKPWRVVAVKTPVLRRRVRDALERELDAFYAAHSIPVRARAAFLDGALSSPAYLIVVMGRDLIDPRVGTYEIDPHLAVRHLTLSAGAFTNNLRISADGAGLGTHLILGLPFLLAEESIAQALEVEGDSFIAAILALGYPLHKGLPQPANAS